MPDHGKDETRVKRDTFGKFGDYFGILLTWVKCGLVRGSGVICFLCRRGDGERSLSHSSDICPGLSYWIGPL